MTTTRKITFAAAGVLVAAVLWSLLAYPWLAQVECLRSGPWNDLKTLTAIGDAGIWLPYMVMPVVLVAIWRRMRARPEASILVLYGSFILLCGLTHAMNVMTILWPVYWIAAKLKLITAVVSLAVMVVTIAKRQAILDLGESGAALAREAEAAREAKADAEKQTEAARAATAEAERQAAEATAARAEAERQALDAKTARLKEAQANQALAEINARLERERTLEATRAQSAEARNLTLEGALRRLEAQDEALRTLESPILEALDGVLVSVLVGAMSSDRAADWTQRVVKQAHHKQARVVVIDVTGLSCIDTAVADTILRTVRSLRIIGGECIMSGVRPEVAQTIVGLGVALDGLTTVATLRQGLERAAKRDRA